MFKHNLLDIPSLKRIDGSIRLYETPDGGQYPSVTTVLSAMADKSALIAWRARVGDEEANRVSKRATTRGTNIHALCEQLVLNQPIDMTNVMPFNLAMFNQLKKFLINDVDNIRLSEGTLYSHYLKVAGSVDLVADYRGKLAVIDFKTSNKLKREEWITDYFLQATLYAYMLWEMTKIMAPTIVVAIAVEEEDNAQIFVEKTSKYIDQARDICRRYHEVYG